MRLELWSVVVSLARSTPSNQSTSSQCFPLINVIMRTLYFQHTFYWCFPQLTTENSPNKPNIKPTAASVAWVCLHKRAKRHQENSGCAANTVVYPGSLLITSQPSLPPSVATPHPHPTAPPSPNPRLPGATICEFISALAALLSCHIASRTRRQSTITVLGLFIFHTPSFHLPLSRHAMLPSLSLSVSPLLPQWSLPLYPLPSPRLGGRGCGCVSTKRLGCYFHRKLCSLATASNIITKNIELMFLK